MECPVCLIDIAKENFPENQTCHHRCCSKCLKQYFKIEIMESRISIACPECSELFHPNDIRAIVEDETLMQKYEDFMLRRVLAMDSDTRWCPAPDCGYAVIATGCAGCPKLKCERDGCNTFFCYHCKQYWHPNQTCDAARAERFPNIRSSSISYSQSSSGQNEIKPCPRCGAFIVKMDDGSCNHMTCAVCGAGFCWLCMKEVSDLHYLSPSGCTFWGRKPWSRKKKILWQLGTLVGAPVGITLVAGIAVPAMIIGIPIWVGRKLHFRYEQASKHRRNVVIAGGVTASIFAAPIIASIVVGIGVPILLAYVYGVVPISLCRSGGCGVTTTNSGGVRFEFDDENETNAQGPYSYPGDNHSLETAPNVANPSIAPSIGDTSLGMTNSLSASGSHMDRAGILRDDSDRDSSSHRALAGTSINGSLCSATYSSQHHKLEVHADISEHGILCEKSSVGGESYNMSLNDDASTKALAGSIISPKDKDGVSLCSRHFDGAGAAAPLVYPEEVEEGQECAPVTSGSSQQQKQGSSSCPTSPSLGKACPTAADDKNFRGKKCTRFMDQVSEIETSKGDSVSVGLAQSKASTSPISTDDEAGTVASTCAPTLSSLSLTSAAPPTTLPHLVLNSCSSLAVGGKEWSGAASAVVVAVDPLLLRTKAESTSVLMDGAESRRSEMGNSQQRRDGSGSGSRLNDEDGDGQGGVRSLLGSKRSGKGCFGGGGGEKEHRSQPVNLSDISEMKGISSHHATGCHNLLAVLDPSCDHLFLDKGCHPLPVRCKSGSSSFDDSPDVSLPGPCPSDRHHVRSSSPTTADGEGIANGFSVALCHRGGGGAAFDTRHATKRESKVPGKGKVVPGHGSSSFDHAPEKGSRPGSLSSSCCGDNRTDLHGFSASPLQSSSVEARASTSSPSNYKSGGLCQPPISVEDARLSPAGEPPLQKKKKKKKKVVEEGLHSYDDGHMPAAATTTKKKKKKVEARGKRDVACRSAVTLGGSDMGLMCCSPLPEIEIPSSSLSRKQLCSCGGKSDTVTPTDASYGGDDVFVETNATTTTAAISTQCIPAAGGKSSLVNHPHAVRAYIVVERGDASWQPREKEEEDVIAALSSSPSSSFHHKKAPLGNSTNKAAFVAGQDNDETVDAVLCQSSLRTVTLSLGLCSGENQTNKSTSCRPVGGGGSSSGGGGAAGSDCHKVLAESGGPPESNPISELPEVARNGGDAGGLPLDWVHADHDRENSHRVERECCHHSSDL